MYLHVKDACQEISDYKLILSEYEPEVIKNDILNIFMSTVFLDSDPIDIVDVKEAYSANFKYLMYAYLKCKSIDDKPFEYNVDDTEGVVSSRNKIYDDGIRISQIQEYCNSADTNIRISENYKKIKNSIISNELQRMYLYASNKTIPIDNEICILHILSTDIIGLKSKLPLIYRLLRSIHIETKNNAIDTHFKQLIYKSIYEVLVTEFFKKISKEISIKLAEDISKSISNSLVIGQYIDPITLDEISVNNHNFINQLKIFLEIIIKHVAK